MKSEMCKPKCEISNPECDIRNMNFEIWNMIIEIPRVLKAEFLSYCFQAHIPKLKFVSSSS